MTLEPGSVALVPFPFSDLSASKKRPVLLLTAADARGDFIAMALTSKTQAQHAIPLPAGPLPQGGALPVASWIRTDKVITLRSTIVTKTLGRVDEATRQACVAQLCSQLHQGG
ncbi:MAG: type II toxin-antitoxin system PemK/MazF family toxin [Comamonas sp.]|jgi:mRNA interferase MazF|nr:type II toxin-antitoxin system PemK/MazF family toxin [Comamonas sp.]